MHKYYKNLRFKNKICINIIIICAIKLFLCINIIKICINLHKYYNNCALQDLRVYLHCPCPPQCLSLCHPIPIPMHIPMPAPIPMYHTHTLLTCIYIYKRQCVNMPLVQYKISYTLYIHVLYIINYTLHVFCVWV